MPSAESQHSPALAPGDIALPASLAPEELRACLRTCTQVISEGSKSFSLASRLFDENRRRGAVMVYGWCRQTDDRIDGCREEREVQARLEQLRAELQELYRGRMPAGFDALSLSIHQAFSQVLAEREIPAHYPLEMLEGMAMDARGERYPTLHSLKLYCFRVAGTVGLMMCHVMGLSREDALDQAVDLGMAMQLTNIARDVAEDFRIGRVYLPAEWLTAAGVDPKRLLEPAQRERVFAVVKRLLAEAEELYARGMRGIPALPLQAAFAVRAAAVIYREIGRRILAIGPAALERRTVVPKGRKLVLATVAVAAVLLGIPARLWGRRKYIIPTRVWFFPKETSS